MAKDINSSQAGTFQQDGVNDPSVRVIRGKNLFPQSHHHASTCRYGEVDPVMSFKAERGDVIDYRLVSDLNTYTLASPLKSKVNMYSAAFKVPMRALYPRNWDIMLPIPVKGDDVPVSTVDTVEIDSVRSIFNVDSFVTALTKRIATFGATANREYSIFRYVFAIEMFLSNGGLLPKFNMHISNTVYYNEQSMSFDRWFDSYFIPYFKTLLEANSKANNAGVVAHIYSLNDSSISYYIAVSEEDISNVGTGKYISLRRALELLRSGDFQLLDDLDYSSVSGSFPFFTYSGGVHILNLEPIFAYQLTCAHFFTNSKVDFVYTAQLWRDNLQSLIYPTFDVPYFEWNGINKQFDVCSYVYLNEILTNLSTSYFAGQRDVNAVSALFAIFSCQRSLRYGDYFTGAHVEPLAVGDVGAPVTDGSVSAIDMTRKLQLSRLLNKVNIAGQRVSEYLTALFGGALPAAPDDVPVRLSLEKHDVGGFEVNNTGSEQLDASSENITTTNLRLSDSKYMFEVAIDEPCWLIAVQYFDAVRIYSRTIDRFAYHYNRFDDFIPDMQFVGDQPIYSTELSGLSSSKELAYAYQLRYMEYKNRYGYASGGFIEWLKSWALITDNQDGNPAPVNIDSDYIRSSPSEFDRFYKSLTGYSLGSYFHFITFNTNMLNAYRQMVYAPEILN